MKTAETKTLIQNRLHDDIHSVVNILLANNEFTDQQFDLFGDKKEPVRVKMNLWGCFISADIQLSYDSRIERSGFLYGASNADYDNSVLYLSNKNRQLFLIGNAKIEGKAYLPKNGVQPGFLDQVGYQGTRLVYGESDTSQSSLPELDGDFLSYCKQACETITNHSFDTFSELQHDSITNPFYNQLLELTAANPDLSGKFLNGKIVLYSDSVLNIYANTYLENVVLVARYIHFMKGFQGTMQAFATDSIVVESDCRIDYPSALVIMPQIKTEQPAQIHIKGHSTITGCIYALMQDEEKGFKPLVQIDKKSEVQGLVYCNGYLLLRGSVKGNVYTDYFLYQTPSSFLVNTLVDGQIKSSGLTPYYCFFSPFASAANNKVIKWLR